MTDPFDQLFARGRLSRLVVGSDPATTPYEVGAGASDSVQPGGWVRTPDNNVIIDAAGLSITNGRIIVTNPGSTVIIDGTSDMFRIAASGTLNTPDHTGPGVFSAEVNVATGLTYVPTVLCWIERTNGTDMMIPYIVWDQTTQLMIDHWEEQASVVNTNQTKIYVQLRTARTGFQAGFPMRYYIQQQVSI